MKRRYFIFVAIVLLGLVALIGFVKLNEKATIIDFDSCVAAGYPVMESYPEKCKVANGPTFVKEIKNTFNYSEGLILMRNKDTSEYACFGCGDTLCKDPAPVMETILETDNIYCDNNFTVIRKEEIKIKNDFKYKIVYEPTEYFGLNDYKNDCEKRNGKFNECGSICAPDAEVCVMMCAFTCEDLR